MPARIRRAMLADLDVLVRHRCRMFEDVGVRDGLAQADPVYRRWARARLRSGTLVGASSSRKRGEAFASGCVWLLQEAVAVASPNRPA